MRTLALVFAAVLLMVACDSDRPGGSNVANGLSAQHDVDALVGALERIHPSPWHDVSERAFKAAADRLKERLPTLGKNQRLVEVMRLLALLGPRDGHSGVFPLDPAHGEQLHLYPIRLYEFSDGLFVVDAIGRPDLVGRRLRAIAGQPVEDVAAAVRPLVPADNDWSLKARLPHYLVVAEVLDGLGFRPASFEFDGATATLKPVAATRYAAAFHDLFHPMVPLGLPHDEPAQYVEMLEGSRIVYAAYNVTLGDTSRFAEEIARHARRAQAVVLDLRRNPGGDNGTYPPLLDAVAALRVPTFVLIGRSTFSAAGNFITELERARSDVVFIGEPSGGAPNQWGDPVPVQLEGLRLTAHVASVYWEKSTPGDPRLAVEPDIPVDVSSADFFARRDPALRAALRRALP